MKRFLMYGFDLPVVATAHSRPSLRRYIAHSEGLWGMDIVNILRPHYPWPKYRVSPGLKSSQASRDCERTLRFCFPSNCAVEGRRPDLRVCARCHSEDTEGKLAVVLFRAYATHRVDEVVLRSCWQ